MLGYFLHPPGLYILIVLILIISIFVYVYRKAIKKEIKLWKPKEVELGPLKLEREGSKDKSDKGVTFGKDSNFTGASISKVAGRDIISGAIETGSSNKGGKTPGVDFGENVSYKNSEIDHIAGRDIIEKGTEE